MKGISWYLVFAMFIIGIVPRVEAGISPSRMIDLPQYDRNADTQTIIKVIETKMIRERLEKLGFSVEEIKNRLDQMSNEQLHQFAAALDDMKVGGDGFSVIISLLVIAILVIIILMLTGRKIIITE